MTDNSKPPKAGGDRVIRLPDLPKLLQLGELEIADSYLEDHERLTIEMAIDAAKHLDDPATPDWQRPGSEALFAEGIVVMKRLVGARDCAGLELNDRDNAARFLRRHGDEFIYVRGRGLFGWTGTHYEFNGAADRAMVRAGDVAKAIHDEARFVTGSTPAETQKRRDRRHAFACTSGGHRPQTNMLEQVKVRRSTDVNDLDAAPHRFITRNGTVDLAAGEEAGTWAIRFEPSHDPGHLATRRVEANYQASAECPKWRAFLAEVQPDEDRRVFLQKWAGLNLLGDMNHQALVVHYGTGANGKSTYAKTMAKILGGYGVTARPESILTTAPTGGNAATPDLVRLIGVRSVQVHEYPRGGAIDETIIKTITGGEPLNVRDNYEPFVEMQPRFKLEIYANTKPRITGGDEGIWRRIKLVEWSAFIPEERRRPMDDVVAEFEAEAPGILNWMLDGAVLYLEDGLKPPQSVIDATADYRDDSDPVGVFIRDCVQQEPGQRVGAKYMFDAFERWCGANAVRIMSQHRFGAALITHGLKKIRSNGFQYCDVRLHDVPAADFERPLAPAQ